MKSTQIERLRGILLREKIECAEIDARYPSASRDGDRSTLLHTYLAEHRYLGFEKKYADFMVGVLHKREKISKRTGGRWDETKGSPVSQKKFLGAKIHVHEREVLIGSLDNPKLADQIPKPSKKRPRDSKTKRYAEYVGRLIDQGWRNSVIARKLLQADLAGVSGYRPPSGRKSPSSRTTRAISRTSALNARPRT